MISDLTKKIELFQKELKEENRPRFTGILSAAYCAYVTLIT
jgi:hypothetical protein